MTGLHLRSLFFVSLPIGVSSGSSAAAIYTFTTIDVPGAFSTYANGINDAGQIVGVFFNCASSCAANPRMFPTEHTFLKDSAVFTTIDVPGARFTDAFGINDAGQIVGRFLNANVATDSGFLKDGAASPPLMSPACS